MLTMWARSADPPLGGPTYNEYPPTELYAAWVAVANITVTAPSWLGERRKAGA